jgi:hypothetical protein
VTRAPTVYVATTGESAMLQYLDAAHRPALLISMYYLWGISGYVKRPVETAWVPTFRDRTCYRHWCLDSGAYSVAWAGATIDLADYIAVATELWQADPTLHELFALDVFTSWRQGKANTERMWRAGLPAIPVYHVGDPVDLLVGYARDYPKIAIGGMAHLKGQTKRQFVEQCFQRVWPCAVHGLALSRTDLCMAAPWHSVDASSAEVGPRKFGMWRSYAGSAPGAAKLSVRSYYDIRPEIAWYQDLEAKMQWKWRAEMAEVERRLTAAGWRGYDEAATTAVCEGPGDRPRPASVDRRPAGVRAAER